LSALPQQPLQTDGEPAHDLSMDKTPPFKLLHAATAGAGATVEPAISAETLKEIAYRNTLLEAVNEGANALLKATRLGDSADAVLERIGRAMSLDRFGIARITEPNRDSAVGWFVMLHEWTAAGIDRQMDDPAARRLDTAHYPDAMEMLLVGKSFQFLTEEFAEAAGRSEQATLCKSQFHSPIMVDGKLWGTVGADDCHAPRRWPEAEIAVMALLAAAIASMIERERLIEARLEAERQRARVAEEATQALIYRQQLLDAVIQGSDLLLKSNSLEDVIDDVLTLVRIAFASDRIVLARILPPDAKSELGYFYLLNESVVQGVPRQIDDPALRKLDLTPYPEFMMAMQNGGFMQIHTRDIQDEGARLEQEATGAKSQFQHAILIDGLLWGSFGIDSVKTDRYWLDGELAAMQIMASAIASTIQRQKLTEARIAAERELAEEKSRMAREIHDTLAQGFTGVIMQIHATEDALEAGEVPNAARHMTRALDRARMGLSEARQSVFALRPPMLDDGLLHVAIDVMLSRVLDSLTIAHGLRIIGEPRSLDEEVAVNLFRIAQEAVSNSLRHARADRVDVELVFQTNGSVTLRITDDGTGMNLDAERLSGRGFGLISMSERAVRLGGELSILSAPGKGTMVEVDIPAMSRLRRAAPVAGSAQ
jgi:signal transduction histidine kinase